jgi:hypothetical protein
MFTSSTLLCNHRVIFVCSNTILSQRASDAAHTITSVASLSSALRAVADSEHLGQHDSSPEAPDLDFSSGDVFSMIFNQTSKVLLPTWADVTPALSATVRNLASIITKKDLPLQEKASRVTKEVQNHVTPLLDTCRSHLNELKNPHE